MLILWHHIAADRPSSWRGKGILAMRPDEAAMLAQIGTELAEDNLSKKEGQEATQSSPNLSGEQAVQPEQVLQPKDAELPSLSIIQLLSIPRKHRPQPNI